MTRVKRGENAHRRHRKVVKAAKGYRGLRSKTFKQAKTAVMKAGLHAYSHRRTRKREFRRLWIARINAACRVHGVKYSRLIDAMTKKGIELNRKMLADLAMNHEETFKSVLDQVMA